MKAATPAFQYAAVALAISIHAAREGGDGDAFPLRRFISTFQSTPPVKAATIAELWFMPSTSHFNPRRP